MSDRISVLVVDDFSTMRRIIKKILTGLGISNIIEADNGSKAWRILNEEKADLVICDWNMPEMTGRDLLEKVRAKEELAEIPFIMVTAESKEKIAIEGDKAHLTSYMGKPFKPKDLEEKLRDVLSGF
ncbi:MAG: response regulator [Desulfococcaceae bacterium]|jgi:two-component system chemotaxis response regulator CheY|nr:response regulator [Desulfococcaceae bacterium]